MKHRCYLEIADFNGLFPRLLILAGDACDPSTRDERNLIDKLAGIPPDSADLLLESHAKSSFVYTTFKETPLYNSFVHHKVEQALKAAFNAKTTTERLEILEPLRSVRGIPPGLSGNVLTAIQLCQGEGKPHCLARCVFENRPRATKMAAEWFGWSVVGIIARLCENVMPNSLENVVFDDFAKAAEAIMQAGLLEEEVNPLAKQAITFCHEAKDMPQACKELCASAMHHRIGTKDLETPPAIADIRPEDLTSSDVYNRIKKCLPKGGKQPEWLGPLKTLIDARKAEG